MLMDYPVYNPIFHRLLFTLSLLQ